MRLSRTAGKVTVSAVHSCCFISGLDGKAVFEVACTRRRHTPVLPFEADRRLSEQVLISLRSQQS